VEISQNFVAFSEYTYELYYPRSSHFKISAIKGKIMVQKIHPWGVIWRAFFPPPPVVIFQKKSVECSIHLYSSPWLRLYFNEWNTYYKGQLISKWFLVSLISSKKRTKIVRFHPKNDFRSFFWGNWRHHKVISKLTDL
jgi:hypothetical protein